MDETQELWAEIFGFQPSPDPTTNWKDFMAYVEDALMHERLQVKPDY
jgi:hypothetical protein